MPDQAGWRGDECVERMVPSVGAVGGESRVIWDSTNKRDVADEGAGCGANGPEARLESIACKDD